MSSSALLTTTNTSNHCAVGIPCRILQNNFAIVNEQLLRFYSRPLVVVSSSRPATARPTTGTLARSSSCSPRISPITTCHRPKILVESEPAVIRSLPLSSLTDPIMGKNSKRQSRNGKLLLMESKFLMVQDSK